MPTGAAAARLRATLLAAMAAAAVVAGCGSTPPPPHWQGNAAQAVEQAVDAFLAGDNGTEARALERARSEVGATGRLDLAARVELMRCAAHAASLVFEPCEGFERLRDDAAPAERAYAEHLAGRALPAASIALLPASQRAVATARAADRAMAAPALEGIDDPLSRLIGIAVLFRAGQADPDAIELAVRTASARGWRRPLLAWLGVQARVAADAGDSARAESLQRRMRLVQGGV